MCIMGVPSPTMEQGRVTLTRTTISECAVRSVAQTEGGGLMIFGHAVLQQTLIRGCTSTSLSDPTLGVAAGVGVYGPGARLLMQNRSSLRGNVASGSGNSLRATAGITTYQLPAPPGTWISGAECIVQRTACPQDFLGKVDEQCDAATRACSLELSEAAVVGAAMCQPFDSAQLCDWSFTPELIGSFTQQVPINLPIDEDYPYACAAGVLGSANPAEQASSLCAGPCPGKLARRVRSCHSPTAHLALNTDALRVPFLLMAAAPNLRTQVESTAASQ